MSEGKDLIGKADALLSKYRTSSASDIPVLTEVVELPTESPVPSEKPTPPSPPAAQADLEAHLRELQSKLEGQVLEAIQPYMSSFLAEPLEMRIRLQLENALSALAAELATAIHADTAELVHKAVSAAVEREFARLRSGTL